MKSNSGNSITIDKLINRQAIDDFIKPLNVELDNIELVNKELIVRLINQKSFEVLNCVVTSRNIKGDCLYDLADKLFFRFAITQEDFQKNNFVCLNICKIIFNNLKVNKEYFETAYNLINQSILNEEAKNTASQQTGIVIITFNRPQLLLEAWQSAQNQGQVIIVPNYQEEETQESQEFYEKLKKQGVFLTYFNKTKEHIGSPQRMMAAKRNYGADMLLREFENLKYLTFLDDDNIFWPGRTTRFEQAGHELAHCDLIVESIDKEGKKRFLTDELMCSVPPDIDTQSVQLSVNLFKKHRWNETVSGRTEDNDYWRRLMSAGYRFQYLNFIGGVYRDFDYEERLKKIGIDI